MGQIDSAQKGALWATVMGLIAVAAMTLPASASAAPCPKVPATEVTAWIAGSGNLGEDGAWSNGTPSGSCDTVITPAGSPTITMNGGASMKSLTLGGPGSTPTLVISAEGPNTNLNATTTGIDIAAGAAIVLTCPALPTGCLGGPSGGSGLNTGSSPIDNAGTITVDANSGTGATLSGHINNTGSMRFDQNATHSNGTLLNQGDIDIADGKVFKSTTSHCGDSTGTVLKNDAGGTITTVGTGTIDLINYEQGDGTTSGANPIQLPCGSVKYTGDGASKVRAYGGFTLTGEMQAGQSLTVSAESSNTNAILGANFTNNGSITLTCPASPGDCSGGPTGGSGFNVNDKDFINAGTFTVAAASGTGAGLGSNFEGTITNTGTIQFDQSAGLGGPVVNKGLVNIADGKIANSNTSSCGDTGGSVKNDTGGQINATGTGTLRAVNFEQGAGTTSGTAPVSMNCGYLKYTGTGASKVLIPTNNSASLTGNLASGQTVTVAGVLHSAPFTNAGTIAFDPSGSHRTLNNSGTLTNTGRLTGVGTVNGSVDNTTGTIAPGASPGNLSVNGSYTQGAGGSLEIEVEGTGAGEFDKLAVGGSVTLGGTLALRPTAGYAASAAAGDSIAFLAYSGTRTNPFAQTTVNPPLTCPKQLTATYDDGTKTVSADVSDSGASCGGGSGGGGNGAGGGGSNGGGGGGVVIGDPLPPNTLLASHPRATVRTRKAKAKVSFSFSSDQPGVTFQCKLDKGAFKPCTSPKSYKVKPGKHKFTVQAVRPGGAVDPTPASFSFKVVKEKR